MDGSKASRFDEATPLECRSRLSGEVSPLRLAGSDPALAETKPKETS